MSHGFRIFPSHVEAIEMDLSKPQLSTYTRRSTELKGVDFRPPTPSADQASQESARAAKVSTRSQSPGPTPKPHQRKRSSVPNLRELFRSTNRAQAMATSNNDILPTKPSLALRIPSTSGSTSTYSEASSSMRSTPATSYTDTPHTDFSAVSSATSNKTPGTAFPPRSHSLRSGTSACSKSTNFSKRLPIIPASPQDVQETRSIFPQYDHDKPLSQQKYYPPPTIANNLATLPKLVTDMPTEPLPSALKRKDSAVVLTQGYECLPKPNQDDLLKLWTASTRLGACGGRKTHLAVKQTAGLSYSIGNGSCPIFTAKIDRPKDKDNPTQLYVNKTNPQSKEAHLLSNISMPVKPKTQAAYGTNDIHIFPHQAAIDAITAASNSPQAAEIARTDPQARSNAAERLAREAVNDAHRLYTSELIRTTRKHSTFSRADYTLQHGLAGRMAITVERSSNPTYSSAARLKIVLHHPSATQAAVIDETMAILSVDLGRSVCIIDLPSILGLEAEYMLDTALAAVFATVAMELEDIVPAETMVFAAPPTTAIDDKTKRSRSRLFRSDKSKVKKTKSSFALWPMRNTGVAELDEKVDTMPPIAKTAVAAVELGVHGAFWLLEKGAKTLDEKGRGRF